MKQQNLNTSIRMQELMLFFESQYPKGNWSAVDLLHWDNQAIKSCVAKGYLLSEIMYVSLKKFKINKKRYAILKKFIKEFEDKQLSKN